ncbi:MAG: tRNA pseudouridine(13) synthase TruD [Pseudomonadota bacterium]
MTSEALAQLGYACGKPQWSAVFKHEVADFCVEEDLGFELSGAGEHLCVQIRKTGVATPQVVRALSRAAAVREQDIGYAGLKDRQGICVQWFSIYLPSTREPDFGGFPEAGMEILQAVRNSRKIRRGSHRSNQFRILLRELTDNDVAGPVPPDASAALVPNDLLLRLQTIAARGVPNYFGEQRFGTHNDNVAMAARLFSGELRMARGFKRGMLLSAARSCVFNEVLSERVLAQNWDKYLQGDVMNLDGTESVFVPDAWDATLQARLEFMDIHPTGPLWGKGALRSSADAGALERLAVEPHRELCTGLETAGLEQARRSLRLPVQALQWAGLPDRKLELQFSLPPGTYATSVLRELVVLVDDNMRIMN